MKRIWLVVIALLVAAPVWAQEAWQEPDEEGCKDSKLITRMKGCRITSCSAKEFDAFEMVTGAYSEAKGDYPKQTLEGAIEQVSYLCAPSLSRLQIQRNAENALKAAGFTIVSSSRNADEHYVTAKKGAQWIEIFAEPWNETSQYRQTAVLVKGMEQQLVADASGMEAEINKTGSVALYGINFDTGKATLQAGSEKILAEIVKLMKDHTDWRFEVQGHTDNVGARAANLSLSEQRAKTVVEWLTKNGIAATRLVARGYGDTVPLAENTSEDARAKNRRVELKKLNEE